MLFLLFFNKLAFPLVEQGIVELICVHLNADVDRHELRILDTCCETAWICRPAKGMLHVCK